MTRRVIAAVEDLLFKSKILETARELAVDAEFPRSPRKLLKAVEETPPDLLILDLNSARFEPLELLNEVKSRGSTPGVPTVGFLSHVQKDLAVAAKEAGCDRVMARSAFTRDLPKIVAGEAPRETVDEAGVG
ncbi:MAG: response regulator [Rubrobacteraceae bacterium]